jgi:hypothetical protein
MSQTIIPRELPISRIIIPNSLARNEQLYDDFWNFFLTKTSQIMETVLGKSATVTSLNFMNQPTRMSTPEEFDKRLRMLYNEGATTLEEIIVRKMYEETGRTPPAKTAFVSVITDLEKIYGMTSKDKR